jgi:hypothetical protein
MSGDFFLLFQDFFARFGCRAGEKAQRMQRGALWSNARKEPASIA